MKKLLFLLCFLTAFSAVSFSQQIKYAAPVPHTAGVPSGTPTSYNSWIRYNKSNSTLYAWNGESWRNIVPVAYSDGGAYFAGRVGIGEEDADEALVVVGNVKLSAPGDKLMIATGSNASIGTSTLVGGTVTVSTTAVTSSSKVFVSRNTTGGTAGHLNCPTASIVNATSFVINSSSGSDTSTVNWWIVN